MAIHKTDFGFVISSRGCWLPGCYEDERAARFAYRLDNASLSELQRIANARGNHVITWGDIAKKSEQLRATHPKD
jgi:hypothetical protein